MSRGVRGSDPPRRLKSSRVLKSILYEGRQTGMDGDEVEVLRDRSGRKD